MVGICNGFCPPYKSQMQITIAKARPDSPTAFALLKELDDTLLALPYPPESRHAFSVDKLIEQKVAFFVAAVEGQPAGCGGVKLFGTEFGEVKRMFVRPEFRGQGVAKAILDHIAGYCRERDIAALRLETGILQADAIGLYERYGFSRRGPFEEYREDPMSVFFEKAIG
jgi:putative acetyltransferase